MYQRERDGMRDDCNHLNLQPQFQFTLCHSRASLSLSFISQQQAVGFFKTKKPKL